MFRLDIYFKSGLYIKIDFVDHTHKISAQRKTLMVD